MLRCTTTSARRTRLLPGTVISSESRSNPASIQSGGRGRNDAPARRPREARSQEALLPRLGGTGDAVDANADGLEAPVGQPASQRSFGQDLAGLTMHDETVLAAGVGEEIGMRHVSDPAAPL